MSRRLRLGLLTTLAGLVATAVCGVVLYSFSQPNLRSRWDFANSGSGALSQHCRNALSNLTPGSRATFFLVPEDPKLQVNGAAVYPRAFALLRTAAEEARIAANGNLEVVILDTSSSPVDYDNARQRLGRQNSETLIIESDKHRQVLRFEELFEWSQANGGRAARLQGQRIDEAVATAALSLGEGRLTKIAILSGYRPGPAGDIRALAPLIHLLEGEGFVAEALDHVPALDDGYSLLIIPGQAESWLESDRTAINQWSTAEMPLLLALGFSSPAAVSSDWNSRIGDRGVVFDNGLVCQTWRGSTGTSQCANALEIPAARLAPFHPITSNIHLAQRHLLMVGARPLSISGGNNEYAREQLFWMDRNAWIEESSLPDFTPGPNDRRGPFPLAVASELWTETASGKGRNLFLSSTGLFFDPNMRERDLITAACRWLLELDTNKSGLVDLPSLPFRPDEATRARIANIAIICIPGCTLLIGFLVFWRRRK